MGKPKKPSISTQKKQSARKSTAKVTKETSKIQMTVSGDLVENASNKTRCMTVKEEPVSLLDDVTIITAYTNIGSFQKGYSKTYTTDLYHRWMKVFRYIQNPLVAYMDNAVDAKYFTGIVEADRTCLCLKDLAYRNIETNTQEEHKTLSENEQKSVLHNTSMTSNVECKIHSFNRNTTWAFSLLPRITEIIRRPGYPKHHPPTVVPEYQSIQHLKYELVEEVARRNPFITKYFAWTDIGLFRDLVEQDDKAIKPFRLYIPPGFDPKRVAYGEVKEMGKFTNQQIFYNNLYWVCGCFFIGERATILQWTKEYKNYTEKFLKQGLANSDQRVIYAIQRNEHPQIKVQPFKPSHKYNPWFDLAYRCREEGAKKMNKN